MCDCSHGLEYGAESVHLVHDINVAGVDIKEQLFRLINIGIECCSFSFGPVGGHGQAVHDSCEPIELNVVLVDIEQKDVFEHIFRGALHVLPRVN